MAREPGQHVNDSTNSIVETSVTFTAASGIPIRGILARHKASTTPIVILCHGFLSHKNSPTNQEFTKLLVAEGLATFRFDWRGLGASPQLFSAFTIEACCSQLQDVITHLQTLPTSSIGVLASSFGGFIALLVANSTSSLSALGLKCPVVNFSEVLQQELGGQGMKEWQRTNHIPNPTDPAHPLPLPFAFYEHACQYKLPTYVETIDIPTLIVHGDQDIIVPLQRVRELYQALRGNKELQIISGADHHFSRQEHFYTMTRLLSRWMADHLLTSHG